MVKETNKIISEAEQKTADLAELATSLESEKELLARYEPILGRDPAAREADRRHRCVRFGRSARGAADKVGLESLKMELSKLCEGQSREIISTDVDEDTTTAIIVFGRKYADTVHKFLAVENVNQIRLPEEFKDMPMDAAYGSLLERKRELPTELDTIREQLHHLSELWYTELVAARDALNDRIDELRAVPKFGRTEYAFIVTGWVPVSELKEFKRFTAEQFGQDIIIYQLEIDEHDSRRRPLRSRTRRSLRRSRGC